MKNDLITMAKELFREITKTDTGVLDAYRFKLTNRVSVSNEDDVTITFFHDDSSITAVEAVHIGTAPTSLEDIIPQDLSDEERVAIILKFK